MIRALAVGLAVLAAGASAAQPVAPTYEAFGLDHLPVPAEATASRATVDPAPLPDDWIARDKALHLGVSFLLTLSGQYALVEKADLSNGDALPISAGSALALGLVKEVADARRDRDPHFCWRDLAADAAGVLLAAAVVGL